MLKLTVLQVMGLATTLAKEMNDIYRGRYVGPPKAFAIPRGGVPALYALIAAGANLIAVDSPHDADIFVDDIIDSGSTMEHWSDEYPGKAFYALVDKTDPQSPFREKWVVFPWENGNEERSEDDTIVGTITNRIKAAGEPFFANDNIARFIHGELELSLLENELESRIGRVLEGLVIDTANDHNTQDSARRIAKMYLHEVFSGRYVVPPEVTSFPNAKALDEMYTVGPISVRSHCAHHFLPVTGQCWVGVVPGERVIGLSKFNRLVDWVCSRPQIQEEMTMQVADLLDGIVRPEGLAVFIKAHHGCMTCRGVRESTEAEMNTSVMRGVFRDKPEARAEFFNLIKK